MAIDYNDWGYNNYLQYTYAELIRQGDGNSLLNGILQGMKKAIIKAVKEEEDVKIKPIDYNLIKKGLIIAAVVKEGEFMFSGSTKFKLNVDKLEKLVRNHVAETYYDYLKKEENKRILWQFEQETYY